ncbi:hypothetical protein SRHO_G00185690 [Serrasalmus rhombeus]
MLLGQLIESLLRPPLVLEAGGLGLLQWEWCVKERAAGPEGMMMKSGGQQCHDRSPAGRRFEEVLFPVFCYTVSSLISTEEKCRWHVP